jgi:hypothetical protein
MEPSDLTTPFLLGILFGLFVPSLMRGRHRLPVAINWEGEAMPEPSVTPAKFLHPKYGMHEGHRAMVAHVPPWVRAGVRSWPGSGVR